MADATVEYVETLARDADAIDSAINAARTVYQFKTERNFSRSQETPPTGDASANDKLADALNNLAKVLAHATGGPAPFPPPTH